MSASSPIPEGVRRDLERMAGPFAERMIPPKVTASSTTRNVVAAVNSDGTIDVSMGGAVMQRVPATTACVGVAAGDEVIVERYGPRLYAVGVVARSLDNPDYVSREVTARRDGEHAALMAGMREIMRRELYDMHTMYVVEGRPMPYDEKERADSVYAVYHSLGGNGTGTHVHEELMAAYVGGRGEG